MFHSSHPPYVLRYTVHNTKALVQTAPSLYKPSLIPVQYFCLSLSHSVTA
jgi:hypothetical protein